jgi:hypothetical protein
MTKKLPHTIYVRREDDGDVSYLLADSDVEQHAVIGESERFGVYTLSHYVLVTAGVVVIRTK